jgi:hypothetical protein
VRLSLPSQALNRSAMTAVVRLLSLLALLLMPFGMAVAPAEAAGHHGAMAAMPMDHCPDRPSKGDDQGTVADCAMPCSAALPAADLSPADSGPAQRASAESSAETALAGIEMEIATPPPKLS